MKSGRLNAGVALVVLLGWVVAGAGQALDNPTVGAAGDRSTQASPVSPGRVATTLRTGVTIEIRLDDAASSGTQRNGDLVRGSLTAPVRTSAGAVLAAGTPVRLTVVSSARAGTISSGGVLSLQLTHVGALGVISDVRDFDGREGRKDVADSAPAKGEEASVAAGSLLRFTLLENGRAPGLMPGVDRAGGKGERGAAPPKPSAGTGTPNTQPGANQMPVNGATQGVVPRPPRL